MKTRIKVLDNKNVLPYSLLYIPEVKKNFFSSWKNINNVSYYTNEESARLRINDYIKYTNTTQVSYIK